MIGGRCLCGGVAFTANGPPLFSCHCHCAWCRRAHGAAFVTWLGVRSDDFSFTRGADLVVWYASSEKSDRGFCRVCGTTSFFRSTLAPGEIHVALACVDDAERYPPTGHIFWDAHVSWNAVGDDLHKYDRDAASLQKYQSLPRAPGG
jgi:hypothetical protein